MKTRRGWGLGLLLLLAIPVAAAASPPEKIFGFTGDNKWDWFGRAVELADVNADGYDDILVGTRLGHYVRVFSGCDGSTLYTLTEPNEPTNDGFGFAIGALGDIDADQCEDFVVGAPDWFGGYARVFSGKRGATLYTFYGSDFGDQFGFSVGAAGDVDADGCEDIVVGAPTAGTSDCGIVAVFSGKDGSTLLTFCGDAGGDRLGESVSTAGDVDGDGYADIVAGAPAADPGGSTDVGMVRVFSGNDGSTIYTFHGTGTPNLYFGRSVAGGHDVDGDGCPDIVAGAHNWNTCGPGSVVVYSGWDGSTLYTIDGEGDDGLGLRLSIAGDVNGDGFADIAVAATCNNPASPPRGAVRIYSGVDGSQLYELTGYDDGDNFGRDLSIAGDINGDGLADLVVGADWDADKADRCGCAFAYRSPIPLGMVSINSGAVATNSTSVSLSLAWEKTNGGTREVCLRNSGDAWGEWAAIESKKSWTLSAGEGKKTVEARFRDGAGLCSDIAQDSIIFDTVPPRCRIALSRASGWTNDSEVELALSRSDVSSGVSDVRLRNFGGSWSAWRVAEDFLFWIVPASEGMKTVEAQVRDHAGNVSETSSASIGLDFTPPTGSLAIQSGAACTPTRTVKLTIAGSDKGGAGLEGVRLKNLAGPTGKEPWLSFATELDWTLLPIDGVQWVELTIRDRAGNESPACSDSIILDRIAPAVDCLWVNRDRPYVLPLEPVVYDVYAHDGADGAGVEAFKITADGGVTWTEWMSVLAGTHVEGTRPAVEGPASLQAVARDRAGNESELSAPARTYFVEAVLPSLGAGGRFSGSMSDRGDIDAFELALVRDDLLALKAKAAAAEKGALFPIVFDLARPTGERVRTGITPPGLADFVVPETGRYLLVARMAEGDGAESGTYSLSATVKQVKANANGRRTVANGETALDAAQGSVLKVSLKGAGLDPASVRLFGPEGEVSVSVVGKPGSAKLAVVLDCGTGTYRICFAAEGPVAVSWSAKPAKGPSLLEE